MFVEASVPLNLLEKIPEEAYKFSKYKVPIEMEI